VRIRKSVAFLLAGGLACALVGALGGLGFVKSGIYDVAATKPHTRFTEWLTHETMIHSVRRHARDIAAPAGFTAGQVRSGFCIYETHCVACHGASGIGRDKWVSGLEPSPPYLLDATQRFTPSELFWIAKNGIKMTGMPSWRDSLGDAELWEVVAYIEASPRMPPQTHARWRSERLCSGLNGPWPAPGPLATRHP
jgi:mono/diheme cytochrome c family protein